MCGIIGVVGDLTSKEEGAFQDMLVLNTLRGTDSTGVAAVTHNREVSVVKSVGDPFQLFDMNAFQAIKRQKNFVLIGHNRAATTGKVSRKNAHPFQFETIVGVHNGTLHNKHEIPDGHSFDTDSEALYADIQKRGVDKAIEKVRGAYALVWYDKENNTINFLRNKERPLNLILSEDKKCLYFASEAWMATNILARSGIKFNAPEVLPEDTLISYHIPAAGQTFEKGKVRKVEPAPFRVQIQEKRGKTTHTSKTDSGDGTKTATVFDVNAYLKKYSTSSMSEAQTAALKFKIDDIVEGLKPLHYSTNNFGAHYVAFECDKYPGVDFRCFQQGAAECQEIIDDDLIYNGKVGFVGFFDSKLMVKISPHSLIEQPEVPEVKVDHQGNPIDKETFNKRYSTCQWCTSPVVYEEDFVCYTHNQCLCESCKKDPEVSQYLPGGFKKC